jgi:hypothetical protein
MFFLSYIRQMCDILQSALHVVWPTVELVRSGRNGYEDGENNKKEKLH